MSAAAAMVGGGAVSAYGQLYQGEASAAAAEFNAQIAEQNAIDSIARAKEEERRHRVMARKQIGDMRASFGASGVAMEGSPLEVMQESAANAELDALSIRHEGEARATAFRNEARLARFGGQTARTAGQIGAVSSLLMAGANASSYNARGAAKKGA